MAKPQTTSVSFTIKGEFITEHYRTLVAEGEWRKGMDGLKESFPDANTDIFEGLLSGKKKFTGENNLLLEDDDCHNNPSFIKEQYYQYFNNTVYDKENDRFLKKYDYVDELNANDVSIVCDKYGIDSVPIDTDADPNAKFKFQILRAETYLKGKKGAAAPSENMFLLLEEIKPDYPSWFSKKEYIDLLNKQNPKLTSSIRLRNELIESIDFSHLTVDKDKQQKTTDLLNEIFENTKIDTKFLAHKVKEQAENNGGFLEFHDKENNISYKIPKNPFLKWCLSHNPLSETIDWEPVSKSGLKMFGDDPNHTDWFLLTGHDLSDAENNDHHSTKFFNDLRFDYSKKMTNSNIKRLLRGESKNFNNAEIIHVENVSQVDKIKPNSIIVIPNASPEFENVAHQCAKSKSVLVTEVGGALCHLATVGREFGLQLYMMKDATKVLLEGHTATIDAEYDLLTVENYSRQKLKDKVDKKLSKYKR